MPAIMTETARILSEQQTGESSVLLIHDPCRSWRPFITAVKPRSGKVIWPNYFRTVVAAAADQHARVVAAERITATYDDRTLAGVGVGY